MKRSRSRTRSVPAFPARCSTPLISASIAAPGMTGIGAPAAPRCGLGGLPGTRVGVVSPPARGGVAIQHTYDLCLDRDLIARLCVVLLAGAMPADEKQADRYRLHCSTA